jgi:hypothetical protein
MRPSIKRVLNRETGICHVIRAVCLAAMFSILCSCASIYESEDYERHRFSQVEVPYDRKDVIYFDVMITAVYPDDDQAAEAKRMEWLDEWMVQRQLCANGYEVLTRREFDYMEDNPARYDLRYEVQCKTDPAA